MKPGGSLDKQLAQINTQLQAEYEKFGIPAEDRLFDQLENYDTTEQAQADAIKARTLLSGVDQRNNSRYGVTTNTAGERDYNSMQRNLADTTAQADAYNSARDSDRDFKLRTLQDLMGQGATLRNNAMSGMGTAAQNEANRNNANRQAKAAKRGQTMSMIGTGIGLGAAALMFM